MKLLEKISALLILLTIAIACSSGGDESGNVETEVEIEVQPGMTLVGRVTDENKNPVVGVVVSDGYSAVQTDVSGVYQMKQDNEAEFVFVSVPAEYEIPMIAGRPQIYKKLKDVNPGVVTRHDFTLKNSTKEDKFTLLAFADVQIGHEGDIDFLAAAIPFVKKYIHTLSNPVYGISLGDLVWDNMPYFEDYVTYMTKLGIPIFQAIGNHDYNKKETDETKYADDFKKYFGPTYYSYNRGDCHFIVLNDIAYTGAATFTNYISKKQLEWLEKDLSYISKDKLIIIGVHIEIRKRNLSHGVTNRDDLYKLLDGYKVRILSGHVHTNESITISETIEENNLAGFSGAAWTGDLCTDGSPKGFGVYEIEGNKITNWQYKGTEHPIDYQMYINKPGEAVSSQYRDGIVINVFAWHTNWKRINVSEDGTTFGNGVLMEASQNITEYDRRAYDYMAGGDKPARYKAAEPYDYNDHMFYYKPNKENWEEIVVEAEDYYGNVYKESVKNN